MPSCPFYFPIDVVTSGVLPYLSIRDLQAVNVAFTSTPTHRAHIKELWKSYSYECPDGVTVSLDDVKWMKSVDMKPVGLVMPYMLPDEVIEYIAYNFPALRKYKVDSKAYVFCMSSEDGLVKLAQGCPLLEVLHIPCSYVTDSDVHAVAQNCRQLHTFVIHNYLPSNLRDNAIRIICSHCPHLKHIGLSNCRNLTDASLIAIADSYPHLERINISYSDFTDDGLIYFAENCHELRSMSVRCKNIRSRGLNALWAANPNLMDVDIYSNEFISDDDIIQLVECCPLLQKLNICDCYQITDVTVIAVAEHCPQIRSLSISDCYDLSDASLIALGQHCHQLKSVDISRFKNISDVGIAALAAGCPLLQEFYARDTNITDAGVVALARGCRDLRIIDMRSCKSIGIVAISAIAENSPLISELRLSGCVIDGSYLYVIANHCRNLTSLDISGSKNILDVAHVLSVIKSCRMLRELFCYYCFRSEDDMKAIEKHAGSRLKVYVSK